MSYKLCPSKSQTEELKTLQKSASNVKIYKRLQCIYLVSKYYTKTEIADILDVSNNTITTWIKIYQKGGFNLLQTFDYKDRKKSRLFEIKDAIRAYVKKAIIDNVFRFIEKFSDKFIFPEKIRVGFRHYIFCKIPVFWFYKNM
jgi:hypothetical protein